MHTQNRPSTRYTPRRPDQTTFEASKYKTVSFTTGTNNTTTLSLVQLALQSSQITNDFFQTTVITRC